MIDLDVAEFSLGVAESAGSESVSVKCAMVREFITRLRQAEKDTARYRWLSNCYIGENSALGINRGGVSCQAEFDSAIDEAMNASNN